MKKLNLLSLALISLLTACGANPQEPTSTETTTREVKSSNITGSWIVYSVRNMLQYNTVELETQVVVQDETDSCEIVYYTSDGAESDRYFFSTELTQSVIVSPREEVKLYLKCKGGSEMDAMFIETTSKEM